MVRKNINDEIQGSFSYIKDELQNSIKKYYTGSDK